MRTGVLVTARLKSRRLPLKAIKPLAGRPMLGHLLERMRLVPGVAEIVICTSTNPQDDPLAELASGEGVGCFRGHPEDVLLRLRDAAREYRLDHFLSCTADNPLTDPVHAAALLERHVAEGNDLTRLAGLPIGTACSALSCPALELACRIKDTEETEIWGDYFLTTGLFKTSEMRVELGYPGAAGHRLTVDTPEDFSLLEAIFQELHRPGQVFGLDEVLALLSRRPELARQNAHIVQQTGAPIRVKQHQQREDAHEA